MGFRSARLRRLSGRDRQAFYPLAGTPSTRKIVCTGQTPRRSSTNPELRRSEERAIFRHFVVFL
jgi:hypothetical protein